MYIPFFSKKNNNLCGVNVRLSSLIVDTLVLLILMIPVSFSLEFFSKYSQDIVNILASMEASNNKDIATAAEDTMAKVMSNSKVLFYMLINFVIQLLVFYFYMVGFWWKKQRTLGGYIFKVKIVDFTSRGKPSFIQVNIRFLGAVLNFITFGLGFFYLIVNKNKRGLHDIISGTQLIKVTKENKEK